MLNRCFRPASILERLLGASNGSVYLAHRRRSESIQQAAVSRPVFLKHFSVAALGTPATSNDVSHLRHNGLRAADPVYGHLFALCSRSCSLRRAPLLPLFEAITVRIAAIGQVRDALNMRG